MKFDLDVLIPKHFGTGRILLRRGENLRTVIGNGKPPVPKEFGVYVVYRGRQARGRPIYVGKAGTLKQDGSWSKQRLPGRMANKQGGTTRSQYFENVMQEQDLQALSFRWFVTHDGDRGELPCLVEARLFQAFWAAFGGLPLLNKSC